MSISSTVVTCLRNLNEFIEEIQSPDKEESEGLQVRSWQDELGRLRMWAANIGAHQSNQSSLDYRLRDSSHIRQQISNLLNRILERLRDARRVILEGEDGDVESLGGSLPEVEDCTTEIQQFLESLKTDIDCLF